MISYTIVIPVYNAESSLPRLCQSIKRQTLAPLEVLFIDDCSTDGSRKWLEETVRSHPTWQLLYNQKNSGVSASRNLGIRKAHGTHLLFLDADDWIEPTLLEKARYAIQQYDPDVLAFGIAEDFLDKDGSISYSATHTPERTFADRENPKALADMLFQLEEKTLYGYPWNKIYRTEMIQSKEILFPDLSFSEDFFFNRKVYDLVQRAATIPDVLYHYVNIDQDDRLTGKYIPEYFELQKRRCREFLDQQYQLRGDHGDLSMTAGRYFRSFASMTARELDHGTPKAKVRSMIEKEMQDSSLYQELRGECHSSSFLTSFLYQPFCQGNAGKALRRMNLFRWGKKHFQKLYHRLKQIR